MPTTAELREKLAALENLLEKTEDVEFSDSLVRCCENSIKENLAIIARAEKNIRENRNLLENPRKIAGITVSVVRKEQEPKQQIRKSGFKKGKQRGSGSAPYANTFLRQAENRNVKISSDGTWMVTPADKDGIPLDA